MCFVYEKFQKRSEKHHGLRLQSPHYEGYCHPCSFPPYTPSQAVQKPRGETAVKKVIVSILCYQCWVMVLTLLVVYKCELHFNVKANIKMKRNLYIKVANKFR